MADAAGNPDTPLRAARGRTDLPTIAFALVVLAASALSLYLTRGTTLWFDEWEWAIERRGWDAAALLEPHNGHLSIAPVLVFKALYSTVGLEPYAPYRLVLVGCNALLVSLVFVYLRRRVGSYLALLGGALLAVFGPGWQDLLWSFQIGFQLSLIGGVGALLFLDRGTRRGDAGAAAMLGLALAASGIGIPIAVGVVLVILLERRQWRDLWIVAVPGVFYAAWWFAYYDQHVRSAVADAPRYVFDSASATLAGLAGLTVDSAPLDKGSLLPAGKPLLVVVLALALWRVVRLRSVPLRVVALVAVPLSFWTLTVVSRGGFAVATSSRYLHVGAVFVLLAAGDLLRGARMPRWALIVAGVAVVASTASHVDTSRDAGGFLRGQTEITRGILAAADIAGGEFNPDSVFQTLPGSPFVVVRVRDYVGVRDDLGSPAYTPDQLTTSSPEARTAADLELRAGLRVRLTRLPVVPPRQGGCLTTNLPRSAAGRALEVPRAGMTLRAVGGKAAVGARRFGDLPEPVGVLQRGTTYAFAPARGRSAQPWRLQVVGTGRLTVCPR